MNETKHTSVARFIPVMCCFFAMGFVDLVGIASNYVKADLGLNDSLANIFPSLVFFWFLIFSVPTGMLMNRIGRKKTVLLSLLVTFVSLLLPIFVLVLNNSFDYQLFIRNSHENGQRIRKCRTVRKRHISHAFK